MLPAYGRIPQAASSLDEAASARKAGEPYHEIADNLLCKGKFP